MDRLPPISAVLKGAIFALAVVSSPAAWAATRTANMTVRAVVAGSCSLKQSPLIDFGSRTDPRNNLDAEGNIVVQCSNTLPYKITFSDGGARITGGGYRRASHTTLSNTYQAYQIYQDSPRTVVWDQSVAGTLSLTGNGTDQTTKVYGRIPANVAQGVPGAYADTLTVTVTW